MKIYTSYFYQIRFFTPNMIPLSTAKYQPKWYGTKPYVDKNGVMNGLCATPFALPDTYWEKLVDTGIECSKNCGQSAPNCAFMNVYREYLDTLDFDDIIRRCEDIAQRVKDRIHYEGEPVVLLIVHEPKSCDCAERPVIQEWFRKHGYDIQEWDKDSHQITLDEL